jgi:hypothetical protein
MVHSKLGAVGARWVVDIATRLFAALSRHQHASQPCEQLRLLFAYTRLMSRYDRPSHQVYMFFFKRGGWEVQFLEADLKTPLPRKLTFSDPEKIRELARRGEAWGDSESRQMLEHAIETCRGGVYLRLTPDQYGRLRRS